MVIAAIKPGISSPSTLIECVDLSIDTTLPVNLYRFALVSFASVAALSSVTLALRDGPQATPLPMQSKAIAVRIVVRFRQRISNRWLTYSTLPLWRGQI